MIQKITTGIEGLDIILKGGIPENNIVMVTGGPGSGKSILCNQFLMDGINRRENGLYVSFEEEPDMIRRNFSAFNWNIDKLEKERKYKLLCMIAEYHPNAFPSFSKYIIKSENKEKTPFHIDKPFNTEYVSEIISETAKEINAKRIVLDSLTSLELYIGKEFEIRQQLLALFRLLRRLHKDKNKITSLITSEIATGDKLSKFSADEFLVDGIIKLYNVRENDRRVRAIEIIKMRGTDFMQGLYSMEITNEGIKVYPHEKIKIGREYG